MTELPMPTNDQMVGGLMMILGHVELAETGHQESIDFCLNFVRQTIMASAGMLDDPDAIAAITRHVHRQIKEDEADGAT